MIEWVDPNALIHNFYCWYLQVGADVTYSEGECRLRAQVPYAKAPEAQQCINKAIDESRPRLARVSTMSNAIALFL